MRNTLTFPFSLTYSLFIHFSISIRSHFIVSITVILINVYFFKMFYFNIIISLNEFYVCCLIHFLIYWSDVSWTELCWYLVGFINFVHLYSYRFGHILFSRFICVYWTKLVYSIIVKLIISFVIYVQSFFLTVQWLKKLF